MRLSVVKQSFFGPPGQYGRLVTRANGCDPRSYTCIYTILTAPKRFADFFYRFSQSVRPSARPPVNQSINQSACPFVHLPLNQSIYLSVHSSVCQSTNVSRVNQSINLSASSSVPASVDLTIQLITH